MATLDGFVERGEAITVAGLARKAGVSPRFIYNHPDVRAEVERRATEIGDHLAGRVVASARVTTASLRADLANSRAEVHRQRAEIAALRERLSEALGAAYAAGLPEADRLGMIATREPQQRIADLEQVAFELSEELRRRNEELEAVRELNRDLMAKLNKRP
jgi:chromosome segregation ATPase